MIKLYPSDDAERMIKDAHRRSQEKRIAQGLRPLSLSTWLTELILLAKLWEHE